MTPYSVLCIDPGIAQASISSKMNLLYRPLNESGDCNNDIYWYVQWSNITSDDVLTQQSNHLDDVTQKGP